MRPLSRAIRVPAVYPRITLLLLGLTLLVTPAFVSGPDADSLARHVTIRRDTFGVPHILADNEVSAAYALGYAQAEDHPVELADRLLRARGDAAKNLGRAALDNDFAMQRFDNYSEAQRHLRDVGRAFRRVLDAYAAGITRYFEQHRSEMPEWTRTITIDAADVLAYTRAGAVSSAVSASLIADLKKKYELGTTPAQETSEHAALTPAPAPSGAPSGTLAGVLASEPVDALSSAQPIVAAEEGPGSNAFAIGGSRTVSGKPMLLGNPHLRWSSLYWEAQITVPGQINFYGSTLIGLPTLRAGFNEALGYVQTNNDPDLDDIYALDLDPRQPDHYMFDRHSRPLARREVTIDVRQDDGSIKPERREFWATHLGPVVYRNDSKVFILRSMALESWRYFEGFQDLMAARSLKDYESRLRRNLIPTSNFTYADAAGNICYQWNARLPKRLEDGTSYELDVPADRKYFWRGVHPLADLPRLLNPPGGYIQNANNSPWFTSLRDRLDPAKFPSYVERHPLALRPQMALQMLESRDRFTVDDVREMKFNTHVLLADRVLPDLLAAGKSVTDAHESADLAHGLDALARWDRRVAADSAGAVLFMRFWDTYRAAVPQPFARSWSDQQPASTPSGIADVVAALKALEQASAWTRARYGTEAVKWGDVHRFRFGDIDLPGDGADGSYGLFRVIRFDDQASSAMGVAGQAGPDRPLAGFGDGWVMLVHFTRPIEAYSVLAYGQSTRPDSAHSRDQIRLFANHQLRRIFFTEAEIRAHTERSYRPE
jgi:acyl-homoserine-lactone acylase